MANWINKILYKSDKQSNTPAIEYNIGTTFDQIRKSENSNFTLLTFFERVKSFFTKPMFMVYTTETPNVKSPILEWYYVESEGEEDLSSSWSSLIKELTI